AQAQGVPALGGTVIRPASLPQPAAPGHAGLAREPLSAPSAVDSMTDVQAGVAQGGHAGRGGQAENAGTTGTTGTTGVRIGAGQVPDSGQETVADVGAGWFVQLGTFSALENALRTQRLQQAVSVRGDPPVEIIEQGERYQVLVGPFDGEQQARAAVAAIEQRTGQRPWVSRRR
ncbi:MAG: SPOR domain-containing protein, partial [Lautropia sp.]|nr:SPOR domain-containing protein [Lautropia sp.]